MSATANNDPYRVFPTLVHQLRWRAANQPEATAVSFLIDGERALTYSYAELARRARALGARLQHMARETERAFLLYPPGMEYIVALLGCFYAGVTPIPGYLPELARLTHSQARLTSILSDAQAGIILTTTAGLAAAASLTGQMADRRVPTALPTDTDNSEFLSDWQPPPLTRDSLALLQYTSGSTTVPRGIMVSHGNLLHNLEFIRQRFAITECDAGAIWLPPYHDMGLIGGILTALYSGCLLTLMSPLTFLKRPLRWLETISRTHASISGAPNFAYELCMRRIAPEDRKRIDLRTWAVAFVGAEPVRAQTLQRFADAFKSCGFRPETFLPCYGLAEATLMVSGARRNTPPTVCSLQRSALEQNLILPATDEATAVHLVSCGRPAPDQDVLIVDPEAALPFAPDRVGEIWLAGPSVASGYWNRPHESQQVFQAFRADNGQGPYLRTGDLGFLRNGELFITGRCKDLIICDGRNHYPQDIEASVTGTHDALRPDHCVAFSVEVDNREHLIILAEIDRRYYAATSGHADSTTQQALAQEVVRSIRRAVADNHDLHAYTVLLLQSGQLSKTSSGKIQRQACRTAFLNRTLRPWLQQGAGDFFDERP